MFSLDCTFEFEKKWIWQVGNIMLKIKSTREIVRNLRNRFVPKSTKNAWGENSRDVAKSLSSFLRKGRITKLLQLQVIRKMLRFCKAVRPTTSASAFRHQRRWRRQTVYTFSWSSPFVYFIFSFHIWTLKNRWSYFSKSSIANAFDDLCLVASPLSRDSKQVFPSVRLRTQLLPPPPPSPSVEVVSLAT